MIPTGTEADDIDPRILRVTTAMALLVATLIAVLPPVSHFYYAYQYTKGEITAEARVHSYTVSQSIGRNPQMWQFEALRIKDLLAHDDHAEHWRVTDASGTLVTEVGDTRLSSPLITETVPIFDSGVPAGELQVARSLRAALLDSILIFVASGLIGLLVFQVFRILPVRVLHRAMERAAFLASHDPLTKLPNRSLFNEWLNNAITDPMRHTCPQAVLCIDLDRFKEVNDILGHAAGDELLIQVVDRIRGCLQNNDFLARLGGDEFAIVQTSVAQPGGATRLANDIIAALAEPFDLHGNETLIGGSVGISILERGAKIDAARLLQQADLALYRAKHECRGSLRFFAEEMNRELIVRKNMEAALRRAIASDELELYFQPQVDLKTGKVGGVEALLRWTHPTEGRIPPDRFIPIAEETGLILPIGDWVIQKACAHARDWPSLKFAVNVSPVQFRQGNLVDTVRMALEAEQIDPSRLEIEITEGILLNNTDETIATLNELRRLGVRIAMDDFGTGYSSLNYLRSFDFDKIKIDRSFIMGLGKSAEATSIIQAVVDLGSSLGMTSNAEGVETLEQALILKEQGCEEVQGFYFAEPMTSVEIQELLLDEDWILHAAEVARHKTPDSANAPVRIAGT